MAKYRKKPVVIDAFQFGVDFPPVWFNSRLSDIVRIAYDPETGKFLSADITTLEGVHRADNGDFVIMGIKGELYPCKADIFAVTYDAVEGGIQ